MNSYNFKCHSGQIDCIVPVYHIITRYTYHILPNFSIFAHLSYIFSFSSIIPFVHSVKSETQSLLGQEGEQREDEESKLIIIIIIIIM